MNWTFSALGVYVLRCSSCRRRTLRLGCDRALSTCWDHDDYCPVQIKERLTFAEACVEPVLTPAGAVIGRYPTAGGAHVTVTTTEPDTVTSAPGWVAACGGCEWTGDQYACWHELWPAYPNIAAGDVRGLLLDHAEEHADTCVMNQPSIPRTDVIAVLATAGTAVVVCVHDRADRIFDVRCSVHRDFCSIRYDRGATTDDINQAHVAAAETCFRHAAACEVTL